MSRSVESDARAIRGALNRKALASERHRSALARLLDLSASEVLAIQHLAQAGSLTPGQLGALLALTSGGATALVQRLERAGCITRVAHPRDRRSVLLRLTPEIEQRAAEAFAPLVEELDALTGDLAPDERRAVRAYLARVAEAAERQAEALARVVEARDATAAEDPVPSLWA